MAAEKTKGENTAAAKRDGESGRPKGDRTSGRIPWHQFKQFNVTNGILRSLPSYAWFYGDAPSGESNELAITTRPRIAEPFVGSTTALTNAFSLDGVIIGAHYWPRTQQWYFAVKHIGDISTSHDASLTVDFYVATTRNGVPTLLASTIAPQTTIFASFTEFFAASAPDHYLIVSTGAEMWYIDVNDAILQVTDPNLPVHEPQLCTMDGYVFVAKTDTSEIYNCFIDDLTSWQETTFIMAETDGGDVKGLYTFKNYVVAFKSYSTEFFRNAGIPDPNSPLQRVPELRREVGFYGGTCIKSDNESIYFWGASQANRARISLRKITMETSGTKTEELPVPWFSQKAISSSTTTLENYILNYFYDDLGFPYLSTQKLEYDSNNNPEPLSELDVFDLTNERWFRWAHFNNPETDDVVALALPTHWQLPFHSGGYWFPWHFYTAEVGQYIAVTLQEPSRGDNPTPGVITTDEGLTMPWEQLWPSGSPYNYKGICLQLEIRPFTSGSSEAKFLYSCSFLDYGYIYAGVIAGEGTTYIDGQLPCKFTVIPLSLNNAAVPIQTTFDRDKYIDATFNPSGNPTHIGVRKLNRFNRLGTGWDHFMQIRIYSFKGGNSSAQVAYVPMFHGLDIVWGQGLK